MQNLKEKRGDQTYETYQSISVDYIKGGYLDGTIGFGAKPAIIVIDYQKAFTTFEATLGTSDLIQQGVENTAILLKEARKKGVQIFFTNVAWREDRKDFGMWKGKMTQCLKEATLGTWGVEVDDRLKMEDGDIFFYKKWPSAFHGTPLSTYLTTKGIDTLIVTGCTTSGCVRGTIYDSFSSGFRTIVPYGCVGDIIQSAHEQNLADIHKRYADVLPLEKVITYIREL